MLKRLSETIIVSLLSSIMTAAAMVNMFSTIYVPRTEYYDMLAQSTPDMKMETMDLTEEVPLFTTTDLVEDEIDISQEDISSNKQLMSEEEINLIALVTMAEAEGEPEEGKRLVIDTILNRVDGKYWPDTVKDVIYQPHQFTSMWNGRVDKCYVKDDIVQLVKEELESRYNSDCVFFRTTRYSDYGVPMFQVGRHYFSSYN